MAAQRIALTTPGAIALAASALKAARLVVYPTETFYGIAACPSLPSALMALAALKGRYCGKALPLIAATLEDVEALAVVPPELRPLAMRFWPGPLTLALPPRDNVAPELLSTNGTVGVRVPGDARAQALAKAAGGLVTATSANLAGDPPPVSLDGLAPQLCAACEVLLDGGVCPGGLPSTVVGVQAGRVVVFRAGAIAQAVLAKALGYEPAAAT